MTLEELYRKLERMAQEMPEEINDKLTQDMEIIGLRFVDDNFVNQSWEGHPWLANKTGTTILVKTGNLKSGFRTSRGAGEVRFRNVLAYAKVHNEGFKGKVAVREHSRGSYSGSRVKRKRKGSLTIGAYSRNMNMPRRQFAPTDASPSPTLVRRLEEQATKRLLTFIKNA